MSVSTCIFLVFAFFSVHRHYQASLRKVMHMRHGLHCQSVQASPLILATAPSQTLQHTGTTLGTSEIILNPSLAQCQLLEQCGSHCLVRIQNCTCLLGGTLAASVLSIVPFLFCKCGCCINGHVNLSGPSQNQFLCV